MVRAPLSTADVTHHVEHCEPEKHRIAFEDEGWAFGAVDSVR
jgi:hypothetical protein